MAKTVEIEVIENTTLQCPEKCTSRAVRKENPQATYKPYSGNPLCTHRISTDLIFNTIFLISLVIWLGVCFFGRYKTIHTRESSEYSLRESIEVKYVRSIDDLLDVIQEFHYEGGLFFLSATLFSTGLLIVGLLKMLCKYPKQFANVGYDILQFTMVFFIFIFIVISITAAVRNPGLILLILPCAIAILINFSCLSSIELIGLDSIAVFIEKTCQSLLHCQFLILYGISILISELLIAFFTYAIVITLSESIPISIAFFGGLYICSCVWNFNQMVLAEVLAIWHSMENEQDLPRSILWTCMKTMKRFHFGSAALQATYIIPLYLSVLATLKSKTQHGSYSAYVSRCICRVILTLGIADCTSIDIAINGINSYKATHRVHTIIVKHSFVYVGVISTMHTICFCASIVVGLASYILCKLFFLVVYPQISIESFKNGRIQLATFAEISLLVLTASLIISTAVRTTLLCSLESHEIEEGRGESKRQMKESSVAVASAPTLAMIQE
ncbi:hypothetical protein QAD02_016715 [Eretmocerus hayati]|uniref:Uncharacterized protein n=1 Tax=Eretmocerus hayati TaxID=131215 RepID=A0ACC2PCV9_9HYME|nr:hypothetical protein QAD02_016715 [Eretmocerus hayati]